MLPQRSTAVVRVNLDTTVCLQDLVVGTRSQPEEWLTPVLIEIVKLRHNDSEASHETARQA